MKHTILATALAALTTLTADAALITWGAAQNITGDSDVSLDGTLVGAFNGSLVSGPATVTVNGVDFGRMSIGTRTVGVFELGASFAYIGSSDSTAGAPFSSLSAPYQSLLAQNISGDPSAILTLSGLTIGDTYAFQWWSNVSDAVGMTTTATAGNAVTLDANVSDVEGGLGQYVIGTFVADATTQTVGFTGRINAGQLRNLGPASVPEPGTALAGVMLAGLLGVRRRRGSRV